MYSAKSVRNWLLALPLALPLGAAALALPALVPGEAQAAFCSNDGGRFNEWKQAIKAEYSGQFKASTLAKIDGLQYSTAVIKLDRNQKSFKLSFPEFYKRRATGVASGARKRIQQYKKYFDKAEQQFGVPPEIIAAIWGLESAFGTYKGKSFPILQSIATLSYDCRRTDLFSREFRAALEVIDRGYADLSKAQGAWAGEIGQTQFLPSSFLIGATDFDGGGVNVFSSPADVIGSTAKWFARNGWQRGGDYHEGAANYGVIQRWNKAGVYQKTIAKLADEIRG
ncbi:MAG: lytic murein transglycosylase [Phyllobacteriaceae bacterium]|nr:lytic murein transglycosylase [Phyllobacteriaceae bacterium]